MPSKLTSYVGYGEEAVIANFVDWINNQAHKTDEKYPDLSYHQEQHFLIHCYPALKGIFKQYSPGVTLKKLRGPEGRQFTRDFFENMPNDYSLRQTLVKLGVVDYYFLPIIGFDEGGKPKLGGRIFYTNSYFGVPYSMELSVDNQHRFNYGGSWIDFRIGNNGSIEEETGRYIDTSKQLMREAQVVLLNPMFNRLISTSPLLPQLEQNVKNHTR